MANLSADELNRQLFQPQDGSLVSFVSEVVINYQLSRVDRRLLIDGELSTNMAMQCARCLIAITEPLTESFSVAFNIVDTLDSAEEELELDEEQINSISLVDGEVDLLPILVEQVLLSLPVHSLCRENCEGLCPYCGVDLNKSKCVCEPRHFNNRFGKLKDFKLTP